MIQMTREVNGNADKRWPVSPGSNDKVDAYQKLSDKLTIPPKHQSDMNLGQQLPPVYKSRESRLVVKSSGGVPRRIERNSQQILSKTSSYEMNSAQGFNDLGKLEARSIFKNNAISRAKSQIPSTQSAAPRKSPSLPNITRTNSAYQRANAPIPDY